MFYYKYRSKTKVTKARLIYCLTIMAFLVLFVLEKKNYMP